MFIAHEMTGPDGVIDGMGSTVGHSTGTATIMIGTSEYGARQVPAFMRARRRTYNVGPLPRWDRRFTDPTYRQVRVKKMTKKMQKAMLRDAKKMMASAPFQR